MEFGLTLRDFWICFLLFGIGACYPTTKGGYTYPYRPAPGYGDGAVPSGSSNAPVSSSQQPTGSSSSSFVSLQHDPPAKAQQGNSPFSLGAPSVSSSSSGQAGPFLSYEPNRFLIPNYSPSKPSSGKPSAPEVAPKPQEPSVVSQKPGGGEESSSGHIPGSVPYSRLQDTNEPSVASAVSSHFGPTYSGGFSPSGGSSAGYTSPPVFPPSPTGTGQKSPSFSPQPEPATSSLYETGWSNLGSLQPNSPEGSDMQGGDPSSPMSKVPVSENSGDGFSYPSYGGSSTYESALSEPGVGSSSSYFPAGEPSFSSGSTEWEEQPEVYAPAVASYNSAPSFSGDEDPYTSYVYEPSQELGTPLSGPQEPDFDTQESETSQYVSEPFPPPPVPSSYIIQSRSGYERSRVSFSNTKYSPEFPQVPVAPPRPVSAPHQPVSRPVSSSKGAKKLPRESWQP